MQKIKFSIKTHITFRVIDILPCVRIAHVKIMPIVEGEFKITNMFYTLYLGFLCFHLVVNIDKKL